MVCFIPDIRIPLKKEKSPDEKHPAEAFLRFIPL